MSGTHPADVKLVEFESMLHESAHRIGRTVRNLRTSMGGYSGSVPGSGSPGGGKGAGRTITIDSEVLRTSSTEAPVLTGEIDTARITLDELEQLTGKVADLLRTACRSVSVDPGPDPTRPSTLRLVVLAYARARRLIAASPFAPDLLDGLLVRLDELDGSLHRLFDVCQRWGYDVRRPAVRKDRGDLLAIDLTERWCTSHLRVGVKSLRSRGELCDWCYRHGPLLVATWNAPPRRLVQLHVDKGRVYAHEVDPFIKAEQARQRKLANSKKRP